MSLINKLQEKLFQAKVALQQLQQTPRIRLYLAAKAAVGKDITPNDNTPDDVACAEVTSTLINQVRPFPIISGTYTLYTNLRSRYQTVTSPLPGDIIISPTGLSSSKTIKHGHVGIVGVGGVIYSNNSRNGFVDTHLTLTTWRNYYEKTGGYPVIFFRIV